MGNKDDHKRNHCDGVAISRIFVELRTTIKQAHELGFLKPPFFLRDRKGGVSVPNFHI